MSAILRQYKPNMEKQHLAYMLLGDGSNCQRSLEMARQIENDILIKLSIRIRALFLAFLEGWYCIAVLA